MGLLGSKKKICPHCMQEVVASAKFCTNCGGPLMGSEEGAVRTVPGQAGLHRWERGGNEVARRIDVSMLRSDRMGLSKRLLVGPGQRSIVIQNGKLAEVLNSGNYPLSAKGVGTQLGSRLLNYFTSQSTCEIYLVADGEIPLFLGGPGLEESDDELEKFSSYFDGDAAFGYGEEHLPITSGTPDTSLGEVEVSESVRSEGTAKKGDSADKEVQEAEAGGDTKDPDDAFYVRVKTAEGEEVGLMGDIYVRIEGNLDFIVQTMRERDTLTAYDLREEIKPTLVHVLQSVVVEIPIDELYGNMELNQRIRQAFVDRLSPTLTKWGLRIYRSEGLEWDFGKYKRVQLLRAAVERAKRLRAEQRTYQKDKNDFELFKIQQKMEKEKFESKQKRQKSDLEKEEIERQNSAEIVRSQGIQERKDLDSRHAVERDAASRKSEIGLEREERAAQLDALERTMHLRLERRAREQQIEQQRMEAEHQRELEKLRVKVELLSSMSPIQIISILAERNPQLVPALQAYWNSQATERELKLVRDFESQIVRIYDGNRDKYTELMKEAYQQIGRVSAARIEAGKPQVLSAGMGFAVFPPNRIIQEEDGGFVCTGCGKTWPESPAENPICPSCQAKLIPADEESPEKLSDDQKL